MKNMLGHWSRKITSTYEPVQKLSFIIFALQRMLHNLCGISYTLYINFQDYIMSDFMSDYNLQIMSVRNAKSGSYSKDNFGRTESNRMLNFRFRPCQTREIHVQCQRKLISFLSCFWNFWTEITEIRDFQRRKKLLLFINYESFLSLLLELSLFPYRKNTLTRSQSTNSILITS